MSFLCIMPKYRGIRWKLSLGNHMRKAALLAAVMLAATFTTTTTHAAAKKDPAVQAQKDTENFMKAATNPYEATSKPAKPMHKKTAKKSKKKMKKAA